MNKKQKFEQLFQKNNTENNVFFSPLVMHFATRHIGKTYREFASDYKTLVEAKLKCFEDFDIDTVGVISDPYRETSAFGAKVTFLEDGVPQCTEKLVKTIDDIQALKKPDVYKEERTLDRIKAAKELRKEIGNHASIFGWVEAPLAEACDLAGVNEVLLNIMMDPNFVKRLTEKTIITAKDFAKAQIEAGCDVIGVGDAICSQISQENYQEFVKDMHKELFEFIHSQGAKVKLHICGNITHILTDIRETNPDIVDIDSMVDMDVAYNLLGPDIVRCGNLNPVAVIQQKTAAEVSNEVKLLCEKEKNRKFILSGGCEITVQTSPENLHTMRETSKYSNK